MAGAGYFFIGTIVLAIATLLSALAPHAWVLYLSLAAMVGPELAKVFSILMVLSNVAPLLAATGVTIMGIAPPLAAATMMSATVVITVVGLVLALRSA